MRLLTLILPLLATMARSDSAMPTDTALWFVSAADSRASSLASLAAAIDACGGERIFTPQRLDTIAAYLTSAQQQALVHQGYSPIHAPAPVTTATDPTPQGEGRGPHAAHALAVHADAAHRTGIQGAVTIAMIDTGISATHRRRMSNRVLEEVDFVNDGLTGDPNGHGTHLAGIAMGAADGGQPTMIGIAPRARLVSLRAFDRQGRGSYLNVIRALDWVLANRQQFDIRVLNLAFSAEPASWYWNDPINRAVMHAWRDGIVVVAAAGNLGPDAMSIGVPANVPYVISVGATTDGSTASHRLASFSSTGPTYEGFIKPELLAPGGQIGAWMDAEAWLPQRHPGHVLAGGDLFQMSGTSQAAAAVSGIVALMLEARPELTPDDVKCRLMASARAAVTEEGAPAYSVFQQGAGLVDALGALRERRMDCANHRLDVDADLAGTRHFGGPANQDDQGHFYLVRPRDGSRIEDRGYGWDQAAPAPRAYPWSAHYAWPYGYTWSQGFTWSQGYTWSEGYSWSMGYTWSRSLPWYDEFSSEPVAMDAAVGLVPWVEDE